MRVMETGNARKSGTPRVPPKGGDMRKHGGTLSQPDMYVTLAAISPPHFAGGRFVGATSQV